MRVVSLFVLLLVVPSVQAHQIFVEVKLEASTVRVDVYFDDDTPGDDATVQVTTLAGESIAQGKTDASGVWRFPRPQTGSYAVKVIAFGHVARTTFEVVASTAMDATTSTREESTRTPWGRAAVGLGVIFLATLAWRTYRRRSQIRGANLNARESVV